MKIKKKLLSFNEDLVIEFNAIAKKQQFTFAGALRVAMREYIKNHKKVLKNGN